MADQKSADDAKKPSRRRTAKAEPEVVETKAVATKSGPDSTMVWAVALLAGVALFASGFAIGRTTNDDNGFVGSDRIGIDRPVGLPGGGPGGGNEGGRFDDRGGQADRPGGPEDSESEGGYLGVVGTDTPNGVLITDVMAGSAAAAAGVEPGDRVLAYDGVPIQSMMQFAELVDETDPGDTVDLALGGRGGSRTVSVTVGARPGS